MIISQDQFIKLVSAAIKGYEANPANTADLQYNRHSAIQRIIMDIQNSLQMQGITIELEEKE